jgi:hypothetical protein
MPTLHIAPGDSAGGSLKEAIRAAGRDDLVLPFLDDLSCGPIDRDEPAARLAWWTQFGSRNPKGEALLLQFWDRVAAADGRIVVWFSRHAAKELAFFLAWTDRIGGRPYDVVDVTARPLPLRRRDGSTVIGTPRSVALASTATLQSLLGSERPVTAAEIDDGRRAWRRLKSENAPFRVVSDGGMVSAPLGHFDTPLLAQATTEWRPVLQIVSEAMICNSERYEQVGEVMLWARLAALVGEGRLVANGDPRDSATRIRLPG